MTTPAPRLFFGCCRALAALAVLAPVARAQGLRSVQARTEGGVIEGVVSADGKVRTYKGIPYAAPPLGPLRWRPPQPVVPWEGVRRSTEYGPRPMQGRIYADMVFHDAGPSEDCLTLNLWMPENSGQAKLPVMVWIFGGGYVAGSSSESRQDGGNLCKKGVLVVSMNYRLGVFGFLAHPGLAREAGGSSGNYGLMDQVAALKWVKRNIAAFGGDPDNVTIFGESAGSFSVSALLASPEARGLCNRAIGESGAFLSPTLAMKPRAEAEASGAAFAASLGRPSVAELRAMPADALLQAALKRPIFEFWPIVDGAFIPADCASIYAAGSQLHVPLLAGWNHDEGSAADFFGGLEPTAANYVQRVRAKYGPKADAFLGAYPAATDAEARAAAAAADGDSFIAFGTWKWLELQRRTGGCPTYRYAFDQALPLPPGAPAGTEPRAPHSGEIEYVFRVLSSKGLPWRDEDRAVSELMASYWTNFAKTGDPNGPGLPVWPRYTEAGGNPVMHLSARPGASPDALRARYLFLDTL
jgi:para-nitrobenzyl esterase